MKIIKLLLPPILIHFYVYTKRVFQRRYKIGKYSIILPLGHTLPDFQKNNRLYDRFLPFMSKYIGEGETIIDVGANIGDTSIMMVNETKANIICIEPSDIYFSYLEKNIKRLPKDKRGQITCVKALVGSKELTGGCLVHSGGTAVIVENEDTNYVQFKALDDLIETKDNISLIKVDTDGYDFEVLLSANSLISKSKPILFWENQISNELQSLGYEKLYFFLDNLGYKYIYIFDNFGNVLLEEVTYKTLKMINSYVSSMDRMNSSRTFYYTDILAVTDKNKALASEIVNEFKKIYLN